MTRQEYLSELDSHLISLPDEEREMAVNFYTEYFDEAGVDNEMSVMDELGKPFQLAKSIISEQSAYSKSEVYIKYRESNPLGDSGVYVSMKKENSAPYNPATYTSVSSANRDDVSEQMKAGSIEPDIMPSNNTEQDTNNSNNNYHIKFDNVEPKPIQEEKYESFNENSYSQSNGYDYSYQEYRSPFSDSKPNHKSGNTGLKITLLVLFIIFIFCPIILPLICCMGAFILCAAMTIVAGIIMAIIGIVTVFSSPLKGLATIFLSILLAGIGLLFFVPCLLFFSKTLPWFFKGWANLMKKI